MSASNNSPPRAALQSAPANDDWINDDEMFSIDPEETLRDGRMPEDEAVRVWREWCGKHSFDRRTELVRMAVSCASGTSAETNYAERFLDQQNDKSCVQGFVDMLVDNKYLRNRENRMRVWVRSMPRFAYITRRVIHQNPWLARERASEYEVDTQYAGVCFDYSDCLVRETINLSPTERQIIKYGLRFKAREGRTAVNSGEGQGVTGSRPSDRGVGEAIVPDSSRIRGSGPYGGM